jgi:hypothetical protein
MGRKGLKSKYKVDIEASQLARLYSKTTEELFGVICHIHKSKIPQFVKFEKRLRNEGISLRNYTDVVLRVLYKWALDKDVGFVPVDTFLSEFGYMRYQSVISTESLDVMDESEDRYAELLHSELMVARLFIRRYIETEGDYKLRKAVEELRPVLSALWLLQYDTAPHLARDAEDGALEIMSQEFGLSSKMILGSYLDIAVAIMWKIDG